MMIINNKKIETISKIAQEIISTQTADELKSIMTHAVNTYTEAQMAAEVACKLLLRIIGISVESRAISPLDPLVDQAEIKYLSTYAG